MYRLQKSNGDSNISSMQLFNSGEYLLLTTAAINFVYSILIMIASIGALAENTKPDEYVTYILQLIFSIFIVILVSIQTQFVMACHTWHRSGRKLPRIARYTLIYVAAMNIAEWLLISSFHEWIEFDHEASDNPSPEIMVMVTSFGRFNAEFWAMVLTPVIEMHRFHSAVVAIEIIRGDTRKGPH